MRLQENKNYHRRSRGEILLQVKRLTEDLEVKRLAEVMTLVDVCGQYRTIDLVQVPREVEVM